MFRAKTRIILGGAAVLATLVGSGRLKAEAPRPASGTQEAVPRVPGGQAERVTVDVVVLDAKGRPVKGLTRDDFLIFDEGQRQKVDSFEMVDRTVTKPVEIKQAPRIATNMTPREEEVRGRSFIVLFDDLHLSPLFGQSAKKAVMAFLDKGTVAGDRITLISTSGSAWWSTQLPEGRQDLVEILKRLEGRLIRETAQERITDYEALQVFYYRDTRVARRIVERLEQYGTKSKNDMSHEGAQNMADIYLRGYVDPYIELRTTQTYFQLRSRMEASLAVLERAARSLSEGRDRKALVLISEGFVSDPSQQGVKRLVNVARRVNAAVYFVDVTGLRILDPMYSAEFGRAAVDSADVMGAIADLSREGEGAVALAEDTGGFAIRDSNDFEGGAARIGTESQSFYLIGYDPGEIARDGRFRKISVKVNGKYTVRARRGYYAPSEDGSVPEAEASRDVEPELQHALDAPTTVKDIPLRMTAYVMDEFGADWVRVLIVADVDVSKLGFKEAQGGRVGSLDTLTVIANRETAAVQRDDQKVDLQLRAEGRSGPVWYSFVRELGVPVGRHQARVVVRDTNTGRVGSVIYEFHIPGKDQMRLSTPILTDTLTETANGGRVPALLARRTFSAGAQLYCRFDVFGAKRGADGQPRVLSGHTLRSKSGEMLGASAPTLIEPTSVGAVARMVQIPLQTMPPGDYELVLSVKDEVSGEAQEIVEPFTIEAPRVADRS